MELPPATSAELALCVIFVLAISSATAWGQNPLADRVLAGTGEDSPASSALSAATAAAPSPAANCCEENCGAARRGPRWTAAADYIILDRIGGTNQTLVAHVANYTVPDRLPGSSKFAICSPPRASRPSTATICNQASAAASRST